MAIKGDYRTFLPPFGIATNVEQKEQKQKFAELLEQAGEFDFGLIVNGFEFSWYVRAILGHLQHTGDVAVLDQEKRWGVKKFERGKDAFWYTLRGHTQFDAEELAAYYNKTHKAFCAADEYDIRYAAEVVPEGEKY
jgi:hypothetical protein